MDETIDGFIMKELIKKIVGPLGIKAVKVLKMSLKILDAIRKGTWGKCNIYDEVRLIEHLAIENKNVFFGYYDLQQFNVTHDKMLVHICKKNADTRKDIAEIAYYDLNDKQYHSISTSSAWSWQQGSRLRWNALNQDEILFNNVEDNHYVCQIWNVTKKEKVKTIPIPLYDIDREMRYGFGVNFARLQRLRPGYGYNSLPDLTEHESIPQNDGIFRYDFNSSEVKLIISYQWLCRDIPDADKYQHYINHISVSPDGDSFMFFHIWTKGPGMKWTVRLCVSDIAGCHIKVLEQERTISHYTWKDSKTLLTTFINQKTNESCYSEYDVTTGNRKVIGDGHIWMDGHPSYMIGGKMFITDSYPLAGNMQHLYLFDIQGNKRRSLVDIFHNPRLYEEKRCDLHPRLTEDNRYVSIDTVYDGCKKSVLLLELKE